MLSEYCVWLSQIIQFDIVFSVFLGMAVFGRLSLFVAKFAFREYGYSKDVIAINNRYVST